MNFRYAIGKTLSELGHHLLSSHYMPMTRVVPVGLSYPYDLKRFAYPQPIRTIFDAGANIGQTCLFLNRYFPNAKIYSFEPVSSTFEVLQQRVQSNVNISPIPYALGASPGHIEIQLRENSELNTLVQDGPKHPSANDIGKTEVLNIETLDRFCQQHHIQHIDLLKLDIQGYELDVLHGADYMLTNRRVRFIYSEIDFDDSFKECQSFQELNQYLEQHKFKFSGFYEFFRWGDNKRFFGFCNALFVNTEYSIELETLERSHVLATPQTVN
jgi:FkbM family methyltransferase